MNNSDKVPSVISYHPPTTGEAQWGSDISPNSLAMVHTKWELDEHERKGDELEIILQQLEAMRNLDFSHIVNTNGQPQYSIKSPDIIVEDYLRKIFQRVMLHLESYRDLYRIDIKRAPVDIVFTIPIVSIAKNYNATSHSISLELVIQSKEFNLQGDNSGWVQSQYLSQSARYHAGN